MRPGSIGSRIVAAAAATLMALPAGLDAQEGEASRERARREALEALEVGRPLRLETADGTRVTGRFDGLSDGLVRLGESSREDGVPAEAIERLWVKGNSVGTGALIGGIAGALGGALVVAQLADFACAETDEECGLEGALLGGLLFGAAGAGVGAGVGLLIPSWKLRFP